MGVFKGADAFDGHYLLVFCFFYWVPARHSNLSVNENCAGPAMSG